MWIMIFAIFFTAFLRSTCFIAKIDGNSMKPTLLSGQQVLVLKYVPYFLIKKQKIVVCNAHKIPTANTGPSQKYIIKRLVGLAGETLNFELEDITDDMLLSKLAIKQENYYSYTVPQGHFFVVADGKGGDSRHWGALPITSLEGLVVFKFSERFNTNLNERDNNA